MSQTATKLPVKQAGDKAGEPSAPSPWYPFGSLRQQIDRLFDEFGQGYWPAPFARSAVALEPFVPKAWPWAGMPAVDAVEKENAFEISAELPGLSERDIEVSLANGTLTIKGEKKEEREETKKDYHLSERHFGAFTRSFRVPDTVDAAKIEANFKNGVLTVTLPKTAEARKPEKKIAIKAA